jgi:hypothetical protein
MTPSTRLLDGVEVVRSPTRRHSRRASTGFLLDDFRVNQFTMHQHTGEIYLVDGPKALWSSPLGSWTHGVWNRSKHLQVNSKHACARDADCP